jgi:uncharacterized protein YqeY
MTLREKLDADLKEAMRAKDQVRVDTVRAIKSAIKYKEVEGGEVKTLDDAGVLKVVQAEIKKRRDAIDQYKAAGRPELAEKEEREAAILLVYMPQQMTEAEIEAVVVAAIAEAGATGPKDMGAVMKLVQPQVAGKADGRVVSETVKRKLAGG